MHAIYTYIVIAHCTLMKHLSIIFETDVLIIMNNLKYSNLQKKLHNIVFLSNINDEYADQVMFDFIYDLQNAIYFRF